MLHDCLAMLTELDTLIEHTCMRGIVNVLGWRYCNEVMGRDVPLIVKPNSRVRQETLPNLCTTKSFKFPCAKCSITVQVSNQF